MEGGLSMAVWNIVNRTDFRSHANIMAEHYQLERIRAEEYLKSISTYRIKDLYKEVIQIISPSKLEDSWNVYDLTDGISNFLTTEPHYTKSSSAKKVAVENDFVISRLRSYLKEMAVVPNCNYKMAFSTEYLVYRSKQSITASLLLPFSLSSYVQSILKWAQMGNEHPRFSSETFGDIFIPNCILAHSNEISAYIAEAIECQKQSQALYHQAETLLAKELQLDQLKLPNKKWYTANYCEVNKERRINAEYFSPDVYCILSQDFLKEAVTINDVFEIIRGYTPKCYYRSGVPVVKTKNVRTPNVDKKRISDYADSQEPLTQTKENDLILAAMGVGSLGRMSYVTDKETNCAIDGTLRILRKKDLSLNDIEIPTMLFLSTEVGQKLIYRGISGTTGIISLPDDYLGRIPIPVFEKSVRRKVTELVLNSIIAKNQSEQLLAQAKHRVEELIEQEANKYKQT